MKYDEFDMFEDNKQIKMSEHEQKKTLAAALDKLHSAPVGDSSEIPTSAVELKPVETVRITSHRASALKWAGAAAALLLICGGAVFAAVKLGNLEIIPSETATTVGGTDVSDTETTAVNDAPISRTPEESLELLLQKYDGEDADILREAGEALLAARNDGCAFIGNKLLTSEFTELLMRLHNPELYTDDYIFTFSTNRFDNDVVMPNEDLGYSETPTADEDIVTVSFRGGKCYVVCFNAEMQMFCGGISNDYGIFIEQNGIINQSQIYFRGELYWAENILHPSGADEKTSLSIPVYDPISHNRNVYLSEENYSVLLDMHYDLMLQHLLTDSVGTEITPDNCDHISLPLWGKYELVVCDENNMIIGGYRDKWAEFVAAQSGLLSVYIPEIAVYKPSTNEIFLIHSDLSGMPLVTAKNMTTNLAYSDCFTVASKFPYSSPEIENEGEYDISYVFTASVPGREDSAGALFTNFAREYRVDYATEIPAERIIGFAIEGAYGVRNTSGGFSAAVEKYGLYSKELLEYTVNDFFEGWKNGDASVMSFYVGSAGNAMQVLADSIEVKNYRFVEALNEYSAVIEADFINKSDGSTAGSGQWTINAFSDMNMTKIESIQRCSDTYVDESGVFSTHTDANSIIESGSMEFAVRFTMEYDSFETTTDFREIVETKPLHFGLYHILRAAVKQGDPLGNEEGVTPDYLKTLAEKVFGVDNLNIDFTTSGLYSPETGLVTEGGHGANWLYYTHDCGALDGNTYTYTITYYADVTLLVPAKTMRYVIRDEGAYFAMYSVELIKDYGRDLLWGSV